MTLQQLEGRLRDGVWNGHLVIEGDLFGSDDVARTYGEVFDVSQLIFDQAQVTASEGTVSVTGRSSLLGYDGLDAVATFRGANGSTALALTATLPIDELFTIPGAAWLPVMGAQLSIDLSRDAAEGAVRGRVVAGHLTVPVALPVPAPSGLWIMRGDFERLPIDRLSDITALTAQDEVTGVVPALVDTLEGLSLTAFELAIHPVSQSLASLSLAVSPARGVELIPKKLALEQIALTLLVDAPHDPLRRASWVGLKATVHLGELAIPFHVMGGRQGLFLEADFSGIALPGVTTLAGWIGGDGLASAMPGALSALDGFTIPRLAFSLDLAGGSLGGLAVSFKSDKDWEIVPKKLAVGGVEIDLEMQRPLEKDRAVSGEIRGRLTIGETRYPVRARKDWDGGWSLALDTAERPSLPRLSALAAALGLDGLEKSLPEGLDSLGGVTLVDLAVDFSPGSQGPSRFSLGLAAKGPWTIPGWDAGVEDLSLRLRVDQTTASSRAVTGTIGGTVRVAGAAFTLSAQKAPAQDDWTIAAAPAEGVNLNLTSALRGLLAGAAIPADLPDVVLNDIALSLTPARSAFVFRARASGNWDIPIGVSGLKLRNISLEVSRADQKTGGALGGELAIGGATFRTEYRIPGELALAARIPSLRLSALLQDLTGGDNIRGLPVPASVLAAEVRDVTITITPQDRRVAIGARSDLGDVELVVRKATGGWGFTAGFVPAASWKLSSLASELRVLDGLDLSGISLVLSSSADEAPPLAMFQQRTVSVVRGFNVLARIDTTPLGVDKVLGIAMLDVRAAMGTSLADFELQAQIAGNVRIAENVVFGNIAFRLKPSPKDFYVGLFGDVTARLDDSELRFTGGMAVTPQGAAFKATMSGRWNEPFGTKGVAIADVALDLGLSFAPPLPMIGIAGTLQVGEFKGMVAVKFDAGAPGKSMLAVKFNRLTLVDILKCFVDKSVMEAGGRFLETALNVGFEDVDVYIVPQATQIGELMFEPGFTVKGTLILWGLRAYAHLNIDQSTGIEAHGEVDPIYLLDGAFQLKGAKGRPKASLDLLFKRGKELRFQMNGAIVLLGLSSETEITFSKDGFYFKTTGKVFDLFEATLEAWGKDFGKGGDFYVRASMRNDLFKYLREEATRAIRAAAQDAMAKIGEAQKALDVAQAEVNKLNRTIDDMRTIVQAERDRDIARLEAASNAVTSAQNEVNRLNGVIDAMRKVVEGERARDAGRLLDAQNAVGAAQRAVNGIQGDIDSAKRWIDMRKREIDDWNRWYNDSWWWEKAYRWAQLSAEVGWRAADIGAQYAKIGTLEAAKWTAIGVLEGAKQILRGMELAARNISFDADPRVAGLFIARDTANIAMEGAKLALKGMALAAKDIKIDLDPRIAGLFVARETATAALTVAKGFLEGVKQTVGGVAEVGVFIVKMGLGGLLDIRAASFEAGLSAAKGGKVALSISLSFMEKPPQTFNLSFDFQDPLSAALSLAKQLLPA